MDFSSGFWTKIENLYGSVPYIVQLLLEFNGFDSYLALKGINFDDKKYFFQALEESVLGMNAELKQKFQEEANIQDIENFKLKLGHKNLIINLCSELQKASLEDFNNATYSSYSTVVKIADQSRQQSELIVRQKQGEEHGYSRDENEEEHLEASPERKRIKLDSTDSKQEIHEVASPETNEQIQYIYETEDDDGTQFLVEQEYLDNEGEIIEYHQEISTEDIDNGIYSTEQIVKTESGSSFENCFEMSDYEHSSPRPINRSMDVKNTKKPKHLYTKEFLQMQIGNGKFATPGRRRPKIHKFYSNTSEGLLEKWQDLVRQSCEVIVPQELLSRYDLSNIDITKIAENIWEVHCPLCTKKLRLQLTHEGKYVNFKRSNFERHLRIVHYKQILVYKGDDDEQTGLEEHTE